MLVNIIGSGIVGLSVAFELALSGHRVKIITRNYEEGASWVAGGMLAPFSEGLGGDMLSLSIDSLKLYDDFVYKVKDISNHTIFYRRDGILRVLVDDEVARFQNLAQDYSSMGFSYEMLSVEALRKDYPLLSEEFDKAILFKDEGNVDAQQLMDALIFALHRLGVQIILDEVIEVKKEGKRIKCVKGFKDTYNGDFFVFTPGAWGNAHLDIPVYPIKGQILKIRGLDIDRVHYSRIAYVIPKESYVLIGATSEDVSFDHRRTVAGVRALSNNAVRLIPSIDRCEFVEVNVGFRPATPDEMPIFDRGDNYVVSAGHFRNGILLAPVSSKIVLDIVERGLESEYFRIFSSERFPNGNHTDKAKKEY